MERVSSMLELEEYLYPYVWAQRQFRDDNYQMGSQALLEDMFFDTFGDFIQRNDPRSTFERRTGKEPWDYKFNGAGFSHKEALSPGFTAVWQAGEGPGNKTPKYPTWTFLHPVVFSYSALSVRVPVATMLPLPSGKFAEFRSHAITLTHSSLQRAGAANSTVVVGELIDGVLMVEDAWSRLEWDRFTVHDIRAIIGPGHLLTKGFWLIGTPPGLQRRGADLSSLNSPFELAAGEVPPLPGIYLFETSELRDVPLECNNKAHYLGTNLVRRLMASAARERRFVPLPMWPAVYADLTPPNLYQVQKERFDELFRARRRA